MGLIWQLHARGGELSGKNKRSNNGSSDGRSDSKREYVKSVEKFKLALEVSLPANPSITFLFFLSFKYVSSRSKKYRWSGTVGEVEGKGERERERE